MNYVFFGGHLFFCMSGEQMKGNELDDRAQERDVF